MKPCLKSCSSPLAIFGARRDLCRTEREETMLFPIGWKHKVWESNKRNLGEDEISGGDILEGQMRRKFFFCKLKKKYGQLCGPAQRNNQLQVTYSQGHALKNRNKSSSNN